MIDWKKGRKGFLIKETPNDISDCRGDEAIVCIRNILDLYSTKIYAANFIQHNGIIFINKMLRNQNRVGTIYRKSPDAKLVNNRQKQNAKQHIKSTFTDKNTQINSNASAEQSLYQVEIPLNQLAPINTIHDQHSIGQPRKKYSCHQMRGCQFKPIMNEYDLSHLSQSTVKDQTLRNEEDSMNLNLVEDYRMKEVYEDDPNSLVRKLTYLNNIFKELKLLKENKLPYDICLILSRVEDQFIDIERTIIKEIQE